MFFFLDKIAIDSTLISLMPLIFIGSNLYLLMFNIILIYIKTYNSYFFSFLSINGHLILLSSTNLKFSVLGLSTNSFDKESL